VKLRISGLNVYMSLASLMLAGAFYGIATSRILGPSERGSLVAILSAVSLAGLLGTAGSASELRRQVAMGKIVSIQSKLVVSLLISICLGIVAALLLNLFGENQISPLNGILLLSLSMSSTAIFLFREVLAGAGLISFGNWVLALGLTLQLPVIAVLASRSTVSTTDALVIYLFAQVSAVLIMVTSWQVHSKKKNISPLPASVVLMPTHRWSIFSLLAAQYFSGGDRFVAAMLMESDQVAFFAAASTLVLAPGLLVIASLSVIQNNYSRGVRHNRAGLISLGIVVAVAVAVISIFAYPISEMLFGPDFVQSGSAVRIMSIGIPAFMVYQFSIARLMGMGSYPTAATQAGLTVGASILAMVLFMNSGANGAAAAFVVAAFVGFVLSLWARLKSSSNSQ